MKWDPRAKPPEGTDEYIKWLGSDLALFQRERPDLPQGPKVKARETKKLISAWNKAREAAELEDAGKVSPEWQDTVRRGRFRLHQRKSKRARSNVIQRPGA
jgi:hypothetical protein